MTRPTFAAVPRTPATTGRDALDQASEASATPVGHIPPTPIPERNRSTRSCSALSAKNPTPEKIEKQTMLAAIARTLPIRSPSHPKHSPPLAAPNRNAALYQENQRGASVFSDSASCSVEL